MPHVCSAHPVAVPPCAVRTVGLAAATLSCLTSPLLSVLHRRGKVTQFFPVNVEEAYEAMHRCRTQYEHTFAEANNAAAAGKAGSGKEGSETARKGRRGSGLLAPEANVTL